MHGRPQDLVVLHTDCIENSIRRYSGDLPRDVALAWKGYLAALYDQGLLSEEQHDQALALLPELNEDSTDRIFPTWLDRWDNSPIGG